MKASERLLNLEFRNLEVFKTMGDKIGVRYRGVDVLELPCRISVFGIGNDFEEACEDYMNKISGKTLVYGEGKKRKVITVL